MYEFLDMNLTYESLDEFQKFKANWLEEADYYAIVSKVNYWRLINGKVHKTELIKGKDLFDFDKQEIIQLVKYLPTKSIRTKRQLYAVILKYMEWACLKGYNYVGNPCDTIVTKELYTINERAFKEQYIEKDEFVNFVYGLECSDVDRAMLTLLRYGVKKDEVGKVKWTDINVDGKFLGIQRGDKELKLPIDGIFMMMMDKAKNCHYRKWSKDKSNMKEKTEVKILSYRNSEYIVKPLESVEWDFMDGTTVYNRIQRISESNNRQRISVPDLISSRKYDLLFEILDETGEVNTKSIDKVLLQLEGVSNHSRRNRLEKNFELLSGIKVKERRTVGNRKKRDEIESKLNANFIDKEEGNYQNDIIKALKNNERDDMSNYEYRHENKKQKSEDEDRRKIYVRDARIGKRALQLANFQCELDSEHEAFISNTNSENYVEAHHLIPIKYYYSDEFKYSIDNEANIVALCPNCHRKLHFGQPEVKMELLEKLYNENIKNLEKAKIYITLDRLLEMYVECSKDGGTD
ncbi:HNH endonuclease [Clostridium beijerinckii]|uniref:HNH endonuclease n=1 Tax=Clostridium beijerinckii TaxID=1520 RepID=UPI0002DE829D|nr:HNH endonuclease [Clostridium beijerinckii]